MNGEYNMTATQFYSVDGHIFSVTNGAARCVSGTPDFIRSLESAAKVLANDNAAASVNLVCGRTVYRAK